jgi:hypothetical protein
MNKRNNVNLNAEIRNENPPIFSRNFMKSLSPDNIMAEDAKKIEKTIAITEIANPYTSTRKSHLREEGRKNSNTTKNIADMRKSHDTIISLISNLNFILVDNFGEG